MQILLTNDDGVFAPGLRALRKELLRLGDVTVVGPALEQSGVGHSITLLEQPPPALSGKREPDVARPMAVSAHCVESPAAALGEDEPGAPLPARVHPVPAGVSFRPP